MILVDPAVWPWRGRYWAHLASDREHGELHDFAARLGLRRLAFQGDHYDVDEVNRARALGAGARAVDSRELVRRLRAAGLRHRSPRNGLRWQVLGEWPLSEFEAGLPELPRSAVLPRGVVLPAGGLTELLRAGRALPQDDVVLRIMVRSDELAAVLARPGCDLPLPLPELVVEGGRRPIPGARLTRS